MEGKSPCQQASAAVGSCTARILLNGTASHQRTPQAAHPCAQGSSAEAIDSGAVLHLQPSTPVSNGHLEPEEDKAGLEQAHHSRTSAASFGTSSEEGADSAAASSGAGAAAASGPAVATDLQPERPVRLERIWVYPIKSCAGFAPSSWPLGLNGLLYDRYKLMPSHSYMDSYYCIWTCLKSEVCHLFWPFSSKSLLHLHKSVKCACKLHSQAVYDISGCEYVNMSNSKVHHAPHHNSPSSAC